MIPDPNDGLIHLHVFTQATDRTPEGIVNSLRELNDPRVLYASQYVGSFQVYEHARVDSAADALDLANRQWPAGVRTETSSELKLSAMLGPKRASPQFNALVRIRPDKDPFVLLDDLDAHFGTLVAQAADYHYGAAVVTGRGYDLLVDLGRPSLDELVDAVLNDLRGVPGIGRTDTSWADLGVNSFRIAAS